MKQKPRSRRRRSGNQSILRLPDLEHASQRVAYARHPSDFVRGCFRQGCTRFIACKSQTHKAERVASLKDVKATSGSLPSWTGLALRIVTVAICLLPRYNLALRVYMVGEL